MFARWFGQIGDLPMRVYCQPVFTMTCSVHLRKHAAMFGSSSSAALDVSRLVCKRIRIRMQRVLVTENRHISAATTHVLHSQNCIVQNHPTLFTISSEHQRVLDDENGVKSENGVNSSSLTEPDSLQYRASTSSSMKLGSTGCDWHLTSRSANRCATSAADMRS